MHLKIIYSINLCKNIFY